MLGRSMLKGLRRVPAIQQARPFSSEVRDEYKQMLKEFDYLLEKVTPHMKQHIEDSGIPQKTKLNRFAMPPEI